MLPKCTECGEFRASLSNPCPKCSSPNAHLAKCSGRGRIYSYLVEHWGAPQGYSQAPAIIAVVELEEGPRVMGYVVLPDPDASISVNMPVEAVAQEADHRLPMPRFRPR